MRPYGFTALRLYGYAVFAPGVREGGRVDQASSPGGWAAFLIPHS